MTMTKAAMLAIVLCLSPVAGGAALAQQAPAADAAIAAALKETLPLADLVVGSDGAAVTIVEYASLTCGHCANFHNKVLPALKQKYIDTGKARLVFRNFVLNTVDLAAVMLTRCVEPAKAYPFSVELFGSQESWAFVDKPLDQLRERAAKQGLDTAAVDACLANEKLSESVQDVRGHAEDKLKVDSTPTFFINGVKFAGRSDRIEDFDAALAPLVGK